jgi:hypothetical protein
MAFNAICHEFRVSMSGATYTAVLCQCHQKTTPIINTAAAINTTVKAETSIQDCP